MGWPTIPSSIRAWKDRSKLSVKFPQDHPCLRRLLPFTPVSSWRRLGTLASYAQYPKPFPCSTCHCQVCRPFSSLAAVRTRAPKPELKLFGATCIWKKIYRVLYWSAGVILTYEMVGFCSALDLQQRIGLANTLSSGSMSEPAQPRWVILFITSVDLGFWLYRGLHSLGVVPIAYFVKCTK